MVDKYPVVTLCGSTRFKDEFMNVQKRLALEGNIVISVDLFSHGGDQEIWENMDEDTITKTEEMLGDMHKRKIDMADSIFVINVGGYIGESTKSEIEYALSHGKEVKYLVEDYGIDVLARSGYNDGYYWDYRFWFMYKGQKYTYINSGSGSGYVYNHEEIAKGFYKLHEGHRIDELFDDYPEVDYEELHNAAEELIRSGKDWCVIYADNGSENEESWIVNEEEDDAK